MLQKIMTATEQTTANGQHATLSCHSWLAEPFNNYKCTQNAQTAVAVVVAVASSLSTPRRPLDRPGPARVSLPWRGVAARGSPQPAPAHILRTAMNDSTSCSGRQAVEGVSLVWHNYSAHCESSRSKPNIPAHQKSQNNRRPQLLSILCKRGSLAGVSSWWGVEIKGIETDIKAEKGIVVYRVGEWFWRERLLELCSDLVLLTSLWILSIIR